MSSQHPTALNGASAGTHSPPPRPSRVKTWLAGSRPRTLTMAVAPVAVGASLAALEGALVNWIVLAMTAVCAILIQAGTNLLNDVSDFESGNDRPDRVGPVRITAAGWATPREVRQAAAAAFGVAVVIGGVLVAIGGPVILAVGLLSIVAGWAYSGGVRPISHSAFGELFVLLFFGVVAVCGTYYLQAGRGSMTALMAGLAMGSMASAVLLLNNYRDLVADARARGVARWPPCSGRHAHASCTPVFCCCHSPCLRGSRCDTRHSLPPCSRGCACRCSSTSSRRRGACRDRR